MATVLAPAPHWLNARRLGAYPLLFLLVYAAGAVGWVAASRDFIDPMGKPLGYDFIAFWSASWLARIGEPAAAYGLDRILEIHRLAVPGIDTVYLWHYPPTFFLTVLPLAHLPYLAALPAFASVTFAGFAAVVRRIAPDPRCLLLLAAFPGTFVNLFHGQNGFLTTAILGGALLAVDRRPVTAGVLIGLLTIKPHFGILIPLALLARRQWLAFGTAAATAMVFGALSVVVLGGETLRAFLANAPLVRAVLETGALPWPKMPTLFATAGLLGAPTWLAYAIQAAGALAAAAAVAWTWAGPASLAERAAILVLGTILATPYLFDYDLAVLALPIAFLGWQGWCYGFRPGEREALAALWLLPLLAPNLAQATSVNLAPAILAWALALTLRRVAARRWRRPPCALPSGPHPPSPST